MACSKYIEEYLRHVEKGVGVCRDQIALAALVRKCFREEDIYVDEAQAENYLGLIGKYFPWKLLPWEKFVLVLHDCTYWKGSGEPRWPDMLVLTGRGAGKDGMIAAETFCLSSPYNTVREYNVDICGNNEEQATRPVKDMIGFWEQPKHIKKLKRFYHWTLQGAKSKLNGAEIKGRTNNPKGKDGLRSGIVIFNEVHQYENYDNVNIFTTGLGKKAHPRISYYTTNGDVRDGVLDDLIETAEGILFRNDPDDGFLPFICRLDSEKEIDDEECWQKANPSLPAMPHLMAETRKEYRKWKRNPESLTSFVSKRMNLVPRSTEAAAADWSLIEQTNKEIPDLTGWTCTVGIDYAKTSDWVGVNVHFRQEDERYDLNHAFICSHSKDLHMIKPPWREWVKAGHCTYVDNVEIPPDLIAAYVAQIGQKYVIESVSVDSYRYTLLASSLEKVGFSPEMKNLFLISQLDICKTVPVIDHCFSCGLFHWGDNPCLRWATNNTKRIHYGRSKGADKGSFVYAKIDARRRKTDPFMALVASMVHEIETVVSEPFTEEMVFVI